MMTEPMEGRALFIGQWGGDVLTFVCYDEGYGVFRNGRPVCDWPRAGLADALAAYLGLIERPPPPRPGIRLWAGSAPDRPSLGLK
jgi:hypothetical protein